MRIKFVIALLLVCFFLHAQKEGQAFVDSLINALQNAANDTTKARILNKISTYYKDVNTDSAIMYASRGMQIVEKMRWAKGIAVFNTAYANVFATRGQFDSSLSRHIKALSIFQKINDSVNLAITYNNLGTIAKAKSDFVAATEYFMHTLQIGKALKNNFNIGLACENLALVFQYQEDYSKGLDYARQSVAAYESIDEQDMLPNPLGLIGTLFLRMKKYDSAYYYYQKSLALYRKNGNKIKEATILNFFADYYADQKDYTNAIKYGLEAKKIWDATGPDFEDAINNTGIIGYYFLQLVKQSAAGNKNLSNQMPADKEKLLQLAVTYLKEAVQKSRADSIKTSQLEFQNNLAEANAMEGDYRNAYLNYKSYEEIKDSIYSQENKNKIAEAMAKSELDKKNAEIAINELTIGNQRKQKIFFISGLFLLGIIGGLLYWQSRIRKKSNNILMMLNNELDEANKVKAKFFGILSHDLRSPVANLINFLQLQKRKPGMMSEEQISEREKKITDSANTLLETMEAMLLWSKGQMEHFKPTISAVHVNSLFAYLQKFFADTENISFTFSCEDNLIVQTDENYLQTIMHNLTANAIKAMKQTSHAQIIWKAWLEQNNICFSISDNGPGVSNEQLKALYDETSISGAKHGLGLHIIRDLSKAIGCAITLKSQQQTGTEFILCIPAIHNK